MKIEVKLFYNKMDLILYDNFYGYEPFRPPLFVGRYGRKTVGGPEFILSGTEGRAWAPPSRLHYYKKMKESRGRPAQNFVSIVDEKSLGRDFIPSVQTTKESTICCKKMHPMTDVGNYTGKSGGENRQRAEIK